jgi:hypothetical protein
MTCQYAIWDGKIRQCGEEAEEYTIPIESKKMKIGKPKAVYLCPIHYEIAKDNIERASILQSLKELEESKKEWKLL